jgi:hypothetical protein
LISSSLHFFVERKWKNVQQKFGPTQFLFNL